MNIKKIIETIKLVSYINLLNITSLFIKPSKKNICVSSAGGNFYHGNPKCIFEFMIEKDNDFNMYFIVKNKKIVNYRKRIIYLYSFKAFIHILKSKIFVLDCYDYVFYNLPFRKRIIFQSSHGIPIRKTGKDMPPDKREIFIKKIGLLRFFLKQNYKEFLLANSTYFKKFLRTAFPKSEIVILGHPRNDQIVLNKNKLSFENGLYKKVILYAPTWRNKGNSFEPFSATFLKKLNLFLKNNKFIFIVKKHPKSEIILHGSFSNIKDYSNKINDIHSFYPYVDILISDYSSVLFDFILLDKPIVNYIKDIKNYLKMRPAGFYFDFKKDLPGPLCYTEKELLRTLKNINNIFNDKNYKKRYMKFRGFGHDFFDGKSTERVSDFIIKNIVNNDLL